MKIWISLGSKPRVRLTKSAILHVRSDSLPVWLGCILQAITQNGGENDKRCKHRRGSRISVRVLCVILASPLRVRAVSGVTASAKLNLMPWN